MLRHSYTKLQFVDEAFADEYTARSRMKEKSAVGEYKILCSVVLYEVHTREPVPVDLALHLISEITRFPKVLSF